MPRILAVIVLYFPARPAGEIIKGFKDEVDDVLIVDNTNNNIGVAAALNKGMRKAVDEHYDWLLTMDQDSEFEPGSLSKLKNVAFESDKKVGWVSPFHRTQKTTGTRSGVEEVKTEMTSGSLVRVNTAGYFEEKLFIDSIDTEYCLRLRKHGLKIIRVNDAVLIHQLGELKKNWLGFSTIVHPASRRYYITRNMLYVMKRYPEFRGFGLKELAKSFVLIILVEDDKMNKLREMVRGFRTSRL
ncbi:MAG TPA: glycosyltransferase [Cyclobacteriaceae bacterium]